MTYQDQIKSPKWQKKRLEVLSERRFKCQTCHSETEQLHVHHSYYKKGKKIWEYENYELLCLCESCHSNTHKLNDLIIQQLGMIEIVSDDSSKEMVLGYIDGLLGPARELFYQSESYQTGFVHGTEVYDISVRFNAICQYHNTIRGR